MVHEGPPDAATLVVGVDDDDIDLPHPILGVQPGTHPAHRATVENGDVDAVGLAVEDLGKIRSLPLLPALGVEGAVDEGGHVLLHEWEDWSPGAQGQVQQRLTLLRSVRNDLNHAEILRRSPQLHRVPAGHYADGDPVAQDR